MYSCIVKDTYPLPLVDEVQDRLSGCPIFLLSIFRADTGSCQSTYAADIQKNAFCPCPGMGLY